MPCWWQKQCEHRISSCICYTAIHYYRGMYGQKSRQCSRKLTLSGFLFLENLFWKNQHWIQLNNLLKKITFSVSIWHQISRQRNFLPQKWSPLNWRLTQCAAIQLLVLSRFMLPTQRCFGAFLLPLKMSKTGGDVERAMVLKQVCLLQCLGIAIAYVNTHLGG